MTLVELKKAAQQLSEGDKKQLLSFLSTITADTDLELSDDLKKELDRIDVGLKAGAIRTRPYGEVRSDIKNKYGI